MTIQFKYRVATPTGSPPAPVQTVDLCAATDVLLGGFKHGWQRNVAVEEFLRGAEVQTFDRGNHRTDFSFTVSKLFPTVWQAREQILIAASALATVNGVLLLHNTGGPSSGFVLYCKGALNGGDAYHLGVTTFQSFTFVGGKVTRTMPTL